MQKRWPSEPAGPQGESRRSIGNLVHPVSVLSLLSVIASEGAPRKPKELLGAAPLQEEWAASPAALERPLAAGNRGSTEDKTGALVPRVVFLYDFSLG